MIEKKSDITKRKIIEVSKHLFYQKGLQKTSLREIAKGCEINQSLVYYYFDCKEALASYIMSEFSSKVKAVMMLCLDYEQDPLLFMLSYVRMLIKEVSKDEQELKFYCELFYAPSSDRPFVHEIHDVVKKHLGDPDLPFKNVQIAHILSDSAWAGLSKAREKGEIDLSIQDIIDQVDRERFLYLGIDAKVLEDKIKEAEEIVKRIPIHDFSLID